MAYIGDDGKLGQKVENLEPDPYVLRSLSYSASCFTDKLLSVQPNLDPIVEQGEERGQWECSHEDGDETKL